MTHHVAGLDSVSKPKNSSSSLQLLVLPLDRLMSQPVFAGSSQTLRRNPSVVESTEFDLLTGVCNGKRGSRSFQAEPDSALITKSADVFGVLQAKLLCGPSQFQSLPHAWVRTLRARSAKKLFLSPRLNFNEEFCRHRIAGHGISACRWSGPRLRKSVSSMYGPFAGIRAACSIVPSMLDIANIK